MKNIIKKKWVLFPIIFFGELAMLIIIANVFGFETENSLYGSIFVFIIFTTIVGFLFKIIKDYKTKNPVIKVLDFKIPVIWVLYFVISIIVFNLVFVLIPLTLSVF